MKLSFVKTNPTENMTVFILDQVPREEYVDIANKIMNYNNIHAEQVGFVEKPTGKDGDVCARLHMMGGEFCGNATRALAAVMVDRKQCKCNSIDNKIHLSLEVSGSDKSIPCEVIQNHEERNFISGAEMPLHEKVYDYEIEYESVLYRGTMVEFQGIIHLIIELDVAVSKEEFFKKVKEDFKNKDYDALGIMFSNKEDYSMIPLVYVKGTNSLIWERGCGSGATALAIALSYEQKKEVDITIKQPGGELQVTTKWDGNEVTEAFLNGNVGIVAEGVLRI
jgi:diaminopimelate epimerase